MVIGIFGESCVGKSTLAKKMCPIINAHIYTGKDYLRLAKSEELAKKLFVQQLKEAVTGNSIIYVISEKEDLKFLPEHAIRILVTADLEIIKKRFAIRMHGNLPMPVEKMLEKRHGCFDNEIYDFKVDTQEDNIDSILNQIQERAF